MVGARCPCLGRAGVQVGTSLHLASDFVAKPNPDSCLLVQESQRFRNLTRIDSKYFEGRDPKISRGRWDILFRTRYGF